MKLKALPESKTQPRRIHVEMENSFAMVYIDSQIEFSGEGLYPTQLKELLIIAENFKLFYENIDKADV